MDELSLVVASPFKKNATSSLSIKDFEFSLSFDLKWMSPAQASKVRDQGIMSGILKFDEGELVLNLDASSLDIPAGFKPSPDLFREKGTIEMIMDIIVSNSGIDKREVVSRINQKQESLDGLLDAEVAALLVAHELGCDVGPLFDDVYGRVSGMSV
ncbi:MULTISPECIES: DUF2240 family protein [Methanococcoides]|uniref:DUF2240 family protein n=1 Tax=Methanococcoides seepicolus TaxID=2828780 RepID=A0A9E4ZFW4_9EURY|nr:MULTISPECIES: DUF2240 family protein [Methanococcoides]MCD4807817.1 DUF2240 family protein [Methanococcoides sp.]MCM1987336.1 DUF2240 family protein [Methanococcoides seepicolus]NOQ48267.1 DUF2240 family protein [Methanococcoides sp.]